MVGHTGNFDAAKSAIEAIDECLGKVIPAILDQGWSGADYWQTMETLSR